MEDLLSQKKFNMLKFTAGQKMTIDRLHFSIQQIFVARYMNSGFKNKLFLYHDMGSGKTVSSLLAAEDNRELYKILGGGNIIILGFQRETFLNEMLSKPDLGYITRHEYEKLSSFDLFDPVELEQYEKFKMFLKKKIYNNEHVRFIGYQELYNMLFFEGALVMDVISLFSNAFIIADEIHNVYNSQETNLYGVAIKEILKYYRGREDEPKVLFMSGTPINNKPSEIIDILNLLDPALDLRKEDFFRIDEVETLLPGALGRIKNIANGYFSVYINEDPHFLPRRYFDGKQVGMLKFNEIPYTKPQEKILEELNYKISMEDHNILDGALPLPDGEWFYKNKDFARLQYTEKSWREKMGIDFAEDHLSGNMFLAKNLVNYSPKFAAVLAEIFSLIKDPKRRGKIIIYHEYINGFGIKFLEQMLIMNGFLDSTGMITANTVCVHCGLLNSQHTRQPQNPHRRDGGEHVADLPRRDPHRHDGGEHEFVPARFVSIYGELPPATVIENNTFFNSEANKFGDKFLILLGSEKIREGYNFKCVREIWITHLMPHASAMLQLWGRAIRLYSHQTLPPEKREVHLKIFANKLEIELYTKRMENYKIIQEITRVINMHAIDIQFYYNFVKQSFKKPGEIGLLPYTSASTNAFVEKGKKNLDTYDIFFTDWEVAEIRKILEFLFTESPAWTYADLWKTVKNPPIVQYVDCSRFKEDNFILALGDMIYGLNPSIINREGVKYKILPVHNKITYYVTFPVEPAVEASFGKKMENMGGSAKPYFISWMQPHIKPQTIYTQLNDSMVNLGNKYADLKQKFFEKFGRADMLEIPKSTELYGINFHTRLLEESISYVFNTLVFKNTPRSEYHEFYFRLIFFYNKLDLIVYANMLDDVHFKYYENFVVSEANTNTLLKSIISNVTSSISSFDMTNVEKFLKTDKKANSNILPVGHLLHTNINGQTESKLYTPQGWLVAHATKNEKIESRENDIIVGFYERIDSFLDFKFKLRSPEHKIEQKHDRREMEKGMICNTIKKERLTEIAAQLNIHVVTTNEDLCNEIKKHLLYMELKDRNLYRTGKVPFRTRYCYLPFE
jgi:hypothetical protein